MAGLQAFHSGAWGQIAQPYVNHTGVWKNCVGVFAKSGGVWQTIWPQPLSGSITPGTGVNWNGVGNSPAVTATPTGGVPPYTYAWTQVGTSAGPGTLIANSPSAATTTFKETPNGGAVATWRCTITDHLGNTHAPNCNVIATA